MKILSKLFAANLVLSSLAWGEGLELQKLNLVDGTTVSVNNQVQMINSSIEGNLDSIELIDGRVLYAEEILSGEVRSPKTKRPLILTPGMIFNSATAVIRPGGDGSGGG